jgi:hypothetical protein
MFRGVCRLSQPLSLAQSRPTCADNGIGPVTCFVGVRVPIRDERECGTEGERYKMIAT